MTGRGYFQHSFSRSREAFLPGRTIHVAPGAQHAARVKGTPSPEEVVTRALAMLEQETQAWLQTGQLRGDAGTSECDSAASESR